MSRFVSRTWRCVATLRRDRRGSSAVEFAMVCAPFIFTLLAILQMGIYYMTQSALDAGVNAEADVLNNAYFNQGTAPALTTAILQSQIASKAGGLIKPSTLQVDFGLLSNLTGSVKAIGTNPLTGGAAGSCTTATVTSCGGTILALRAQSPVLSFAPYFGSLLVVRSAVLVRRQGQ